MCGPNYRLITKINLTVSFFCCCFREIFLRGFILESKLPGRGVFSCFTEIFLEVPGVLGVFLREQVRVDRGGSVFGICREEIPLAWREVFFIIGRGIEGCLW